MGRAYVNFVFVLAMSLFCLQPALNAQDFTRRIVYRIPGMEKADVQKDIVYRRDAETAMKMDVYMPSGLGSDEHRPAVIFIHGGYLPRDLAFLPKDWGVYVSYGQLLAASGLIAVTFNHRYYGWDEKNLETSFSDVDEAIRFVRANAGRYHVDADRICLWAFSGGGPHLGIAFRQKMEYVRCLVSYYAILDLSGYSSIAKVPAGILAKYSPVTYLSEKSGYLPPLLIARAGLDSPEINRSVELFVSRYLALNGEMNLLSHPQGRHGFDILDDCERTREIIAATVTFIKDNLGRQAYPAGAAAVQKNLKE